MFLPVIVPKIGLGPKTVTFKTSAVDTSNASTYTFSSQAIGTAQSDRFVVVAVHGSAVNSTSISGVTLDYGLGDTAMTLVAAQSNSQTDAGLYILNAPSGTTGTIKVTFGAGKGRCGIGVWTITGLSSATPNDTKVSTANPLTGSLSTLASGVAIVTASVRVSSSFTPTNYTEDFDTQIEAAATQTGGSVATSGGSLAVTATQASSTEPCFAAACW